MTINVQDCKDKQLIAEQFSSFVQHLVNRMYVFNIRKHNGSNFRDGDNGDTLGTSYKTFSIYLKSQFVNIYRVAYTIANCFVCENSN